MSIVALLSAWATGAVAASSVTVESKSVPRGAEGVTIGVYVTTDQPVSAVVFPLEFRSVDSGA
jgi:MFS-type transporter involved in bile tolerance (Atg22 family)